MNGLKHRYDFAFFFDVRDGNPNGDPDAGNLPRMDPDTGQGLVSDVALKRKIRDFVAEARSGDKGYGIYVAENAVLNEQHRQAYTAVRKTDEKIQKAKTLAPKDDAEAAELRAWMCANFFDIRTFGAVMSTGINCGQVRGPLQFTFGRSVEPIMPREVTITRMATANEPGPRKRTTDNVGDSEARGDHRTMASKAIVPYGLYRAHGFINAKLAQKTGFSHNDIELIKEALSRLFDLDRSASRGEMTARRCIAFRHESDLGNAPAHKLFDRITVSRAYAGDRFEVGDPRTQSWPPAHSFSDYDFKLDKTDLPSTITVEEWI